MSRSYKKTPAGGITKAESEKEDKELWHRKWRRTTKSMLHNVDEDDVYPEEKDVSNPWAMSKDGRQYWDAHENPHTSHENGRKTKKELKEAYQWYSK